MYVYIYIYMVQCYIHNILCSIVDDTYNDTMLHIKKATNDDDNANAVMYVYIYIYVYVYRHIM